MSEHPQLEDVLEFLANRYPIKITKINNHLKLSKPGNPTHYIPISLLSSCNVWVAKQDVQYVLNIHHSKFHHPIEFSVKTIDDPNAYDTLTAVAEKLLTMSV